MWLVVIPAWTAARVPFLRPCKRATPWVVGFTTPAARSVPLVFGIFQVSTRLYEYRGDGEEAQFVTAKLLLFDSILWENQLQIVTNNSKVTLNGLDYAKKLYNDSNMSEIVSVRHIKSK